MNNNIAMNGDVSSSTASSSNASRQQHPYRNIVCDSTRKIVNYYSDATMEGFLKLKLSTECIDRFFSDIPASKARTATLLFIKFANDQLSQVKDLNPSEITHRICARYEFYLKQKYKTEEEADKVANVPVGNELWDECFRQVIYFKVPKYGTAIDKLMHVRQPESEEREKFIEEGVYYLLEDEEWFQNGVAWIECFKLSKIKNSEFDTLIYKAHIVNAGLAFDMLLTTDDYRMRYLRLLDSTLARVLDNQRYVNQNEEAFVRQIGRGNIAKLIGKQAKKLGIDIEKNEFRAHRARVISDLLYKYNCESREVFEAHVIEAFRNRDMQYKIEFVEALRRDRRYGYMWAKYFNVPLSNFQRFAADAALEEEANNFVERMRARSATPVAEDSIEKCNIFGKEYSLITIGTGKALREFSQQYLIDQRPTVLGLDCEGGSLATGTDSKVTVLQIATSEWLCIVDVYLLSKELSDDDWYNFFSLVFHPDILKIGFAFASDYCFILGAFPHLLALLQEENRKVFCVSKLVQGVLINLKAEKAVFPEKVPANVSLADITDTVLGYGLNKEMQNSNWTQRPLSQEQKIYAVSDALVVILLKDKIEDELKSKLEESEVEELLQGAFITRVAKVKADKKDKIDIDAMMSKSKKTVDFCDVVEEAKNVAEYLKSTGEKTVHPKDIRLILDAPFFNLFSFLHNLGIDAYDVRLKGVNNQKQQIAIIDEEISKDPNAILVTTEKRKKDFPSVASLAVQSKRVVIMATTGDFVSINYIKRILNQLKIAVDEDFFYSRCEKCSSTNIEPLPSPLYVFIYYIYLVIKKVGFRYAVTMEDIRKAAMDLKSMKPSEYSDVEVNVFFKEKKFLPEIIIETKNYKIKPLACQMIRKPENNEENIINLKPSGSTFFACKTGVCHIICLDCGNMYHKDDSKEIRDAIIAGKESYRLSSMSDTQPEEARMQVIGAVRDVFKAGAKDMGV